MYAYLTDNINWVQVFNNNTSIPVGIPKTGNFQYFSPLKTISVSIPHIPVKYIIIIQLLNSISNKPYKSKTQIIEKSDYLIAINLENPIQIAWTVHNQRGIVGIQSDKQPNNNQYQNLSSKYSFYSFSYFPLIFPFFSFHFRFSFVFHN